MTSPATPTIPVHDLRVGMFVHLDLSWMSHPFPLGSFRIGSAEQIETIRGLGLKTVRWNPDKSDPAVLATDGDGAPLPSPLVSAQHAAGAVAGAVATGGASAGSASLAGAHVPAAVADTPEQAHRRERRRLLAAQRAALALCERQYGEASREWRKASELVPTEPQVARERTEALSRALVDKMLDQRETCIRLLSEGAGDRATAHALNVTVISLLLGKLIGLDADDMLDLGTGALLHDIGKIDLPDRLRHPDDGFTAAESNFYREHVAHGVQHGRRMGLGATALLVIAQHHEHVDGSGFPQRLHGDRLALAARVVALVNRYDNLCNPLHVGRALTPHEALSLLFAQARQRYDATVLNTFIRMMGVYPPGSVVQLTDDRWASVMTVNSARPLKPRVLVHDPKVPRDEALYVDLERDSTLGIRRSVRPAQLPPSALQYLAPAARVAYYFEPAAVAGAEATPAEEATA